MSISETYQRARRGLAVVAVALACALAGAGLAPATAWASIAGAALGVNVEVPSTIEQRPGAGDPDPGRRPGSAAVLGVNLQVPQAPQQTPGGDAGSQTSGAAAVLGINLSVPPTIEQSTGSGKGGASGVLGVNLSVPEAVPDPDDPDNPGNITGDKTSGASAVLGINLNVPSTVEQATGDASGSESVLGVNLKVPVSETITFHGNGGRGMVSVVLAGHGLEAPDASRFTWPGHHIVGWYVDAACTGDAVAFPLADDDELLSNHKNFYAKWEADDPRVVGAVELHLVESAANGGNDTLIAEAERETHGIVGDGGAPDGYVEAADADELGAPVYEGRYYVGGDAEVWPDGSGSDVSVLDGGTLALPTPEMEDSADEMRSGWFDGWYKSCEPVVDAAGQPVLDSTGHPTYAYADPVRKVGDAYVIDRFDEGTGQGGEPAYGQVLYAKWKTGQKQWFTFNAGEGAWDDGETVKAVKVPHGERVSPDAVPVPQREGYVFHSWRVGTAEGPVEGAPAWSFGTRVLQDTWVYASWSRVEHVVTFDSAGGSAVSPRKVPHGERVAEPATARPGYELLGWWLDADGDGLIGDDEQRYDFSTPVTAPIRLIARWQEKGPDPVIEYTVEFVVVGDADTEFPAQTVRYGRPATRPADPDPREGFTFRGWFVDEACTSEWDFMTPLTEAHVGEGGTLTLYAEWRAPAELAVTFDANGGLWEGAGEGGSDLSEVVVAVTEGDAVDPSQVPGLPGSALAAPKRAGWQFAGWHVAAADGDGSGDGSEGDGDDGSAPGEVALGEAWDPASPVTEDVRLYARWSLRLDVTVPVSVAFAVDASTGEATPPDAGRYALKSRTVREVEVEALASASHEPEVRAFFELPEGALPEGAAEADVLAAWQAALHEARLSVGVDAPGDPTGVEVSLADAAGGYGPMADASGAPVVDDAGNAVMGWTSSRALTDAERAAFRIAAFSYAPGGTAFDELWQGADPCERLGLRLGLSIPVDRLKVRADLDGLSPITHLRLTVSARE